MKIICEESELTNIADAIRSKTGTSSLMRVSDMPNKINNISGSAGENITITIKFPEMETAYGISYDYYDSDGVLSSLYKTYYSKSTSLSVAKNSCIAIVDMYDSGQSFGGITFSNCTKLFPSKVSSLPYTMIVQMSTTAATISITLTECCFVSGTQILLDLYGNTKPIEEIKSGDTVVSYNVETKEKYLTIVNRLVTNPYSRNMAEITLDNGVVLNMTDYHPLYCIDGWKSLTGYKNYNILEIGDVVITDIGSSKIENINLYTLEEPITTYALDVRDENEYLDDDTNDNFYANGVVAHNASCPT